ELVLIARGEDLLERGDSGAALDHLVQRLVEGVKIERLPDRQSETPAALEDAVCLLQSGARIGEEHQPELAEHEVERSVRERQRLGLPLPPLDLPVLARRRRAR